MNEGLIGGDETVPPGQQVSFEHAFHRVLAEHLDDAAIRREFAAILVLGKVLGDPEFLGDLVDCLQFVGSRFVGAEHAEVGHVQLHYVSEEDTQGRDVLGFDCAGMVHLDTVVAKRREP